MPNIKSAIKRVSVSQRKNAANKMYRSSLRTAVKNTYAAIETSDEKAAELVSDAIVKIDKAAGKGYTHKNAAARQKSRLAKAYNKMEKA